MDGGAPLDSGVTDAGQRDSGVMPADGGSADGGQCLLDAGTLVGDITFSTLPGSACSYSYLETKTAAVSAASSAGQCGACLEIVRADGGSGRTVAVVTDNCPQCAPGDVDLSPAAFIDVGPLSEGRIAGVARVIDCPPAGDPFVTVQSGSNPFFVALVVERAARAIASVELRDSSTTTFMPMSLGPSNRYQAVPMGGLTLPLTLRITDAIGAVRTVTLPTLNAASVTFSQFPAACP